MNRGGTKHGRTKHGRTKHGRTRHVALCAWLALQGCASAGGKKPPHAADDDACAVQLELAPIADHLARVRGHALVHPIGVRVLSDADFERTARSGEAEPTDAQKRAQAAFSRFFSFAPAAKRDLKNLIGFYDPNHREMIVRERLQDSDELRETFAHELEHAVQDQTGVLVDLASFRKTRGDDATLAVRSMEEGDATVAGWIWDAMGSDGLWLATHEGWKRSVSRTMQVVDPSLGVYFAGARLVFDLYSVGSFPLVDAALKSPPRTMEQVLHPEKYLKGELPVIVAKQPVAAGWSVRARGEMGEMMIRFVLSRALPWYAARRAAEGWRGDAYVVAEQKEHRLAGVWTTAWDDEVAAQRFERALRTYASFLEGLEGAPSLPPYSIPPSATVQRVGAIVTFMRGWSDADAPPMAAVLATIGPLRADEPPLAGSKTLAPIVEPIVAADPKAKLVGKTLSTESAPISATVPEAFEASASEPTATWEIERPGPAPRSGASLSIVDASRATASLGNDGRWKRSEPQTRTVKIGAIDATETRWDVTREGDPIGSLALVTFPICAGKMGVRVVVYARTQDDRAALDAFVRGIVVAPNAACP